MSEDKEMDRISDDRKKIHFKDGDSKVFTDKNGKPVVATKYLERLEEKRLKKMLEEPWSPPTQNLSSEDF